MNEKTELRSCWKSVLLSGRQLGGATRVGARNVRRGIKAASQLLTFPLAANPPTSFPASRREKDLEAKLQLPARLSSDEPLGHFQSRSRSRHLGLFTQMG